MSENKTFTDATLGTVQAGTERTTSDGLSAWTESEVNDLRMKVTWATENNANCRLNLDHLYINVDYNLPSFTIKLSEGLIKLTNGLVRIS